MDHIVYLDKKSNELENILTKKQDIILRGATGRKLPYDRVTVGDNLYLTVNDGEQLIKTKALVKNVLFSDKLTKEESEELVDSYSKRISLHPKTLARFRGKRYVTIIEITDVTEVDPFSFNKDAFGNMDDWLMVENINVVK